MAHTIRHIVVFGYFGADNLGDDTNLSELVLFLRKIRPGIVITVISATPGTTAQKLGVESVGKYDWAGIARVFRRADLLIGGGGSLFQDRSSLRSLFYYTALIYMARWYGLEIFLYGQGIGPLRSGTGKQMARWALSQARVITVRDRLSASALESLRIKGPAIHLTAEPLLLKEQLPESQVKQYWERVFGRGGYKLGLIPQECDLLNIRFWVKLLAVLREAYPELYLITAAKEDWHLNQKLAADFGIPILPVQNWEMLQQAIGGLNLVVSARLHGLVAAFIQGTPAYGLAPDPKIDGFCLPLKINYCPLPAWTNPLLLCDKIWNDLKQPAVFRKPRPAERAYWRRCAFRNQTLLRQFITGVRARGGS